MTAKELKIVLLSSGGPIIEFYDFMIFIYFADIIAAHYFSGSEYSKYIYIFSVFALGYLVRPLGGITFGHFGDKIGRKNTFFAALFMISIATLLMGFVPSYRDIGVISPIIFILLRIIQGFSLGGELPGATTFIYESMPPGRKIFGTSFVKSGINLGMLFAAVLAVVLYAFVEVHVISRSVLWRIPFIIGGVFGIAIGFMRYSLMETPIFEKLLKTDQVMRFPILELFRRVPRSVFKGILIYFFLIYFTIVMVVMPNLLASYLKYYTLQQTSFVNSIAILLIILLIPVSGFLADKYKLNVYFYFAGSCILLALSSFFVFYLFQTKIFGCLLAGYIIYVLISCVALSMELAILSNLFPPIVRYSGLGAVMNIGAIGLGLVPLVSLLLIEAAGDLLFPLVLLSVFACLVSSFAALWLYFRPPNRKKLLKLQRDAKKLYSMINVMPLEHETKTYIKNDIEKSTELIKTDDIDTSIETIKEADGNFENAGDFINEYTKKFLAAKTEREKMILSKMMHYEYDAVVYNKSISESFRKHIADEVDTYLKNNPEKSGN
jgi:MFS family permease